jgi:hypothetical protein
VSMPVTSWARRDSIACSRSESVTSPTGWSRSRTPRNSSTDAGSPDNFARTRDRADPSPAIAPASSGPTGPNDTIRRLASGSLRNTATARVKNEPRADLRWWTERGSPTDLTWHTSVRRAPANTAKSSIPSGWTLSPALSVSAR